MTTAASPRPPPTVRTSANRRQVRRIEAGVLPLLFAALHSPLLFAALTGPLGPPAGRSGHGPVRSLPCRSACSLGLSARQYVSQVVVAPQVQESSGEVVAGEDLAHRSVREHRSDGSSDYRSDRENLNIVDLLVRRQRQRVGNQNSFNGGVLQPAYRWS